MPQWMPVGAAFLALLLFHMYLARHMTGPVLYEDGMGYLGAARYLAGNDATFQLGPMSFYHVAYSMLIAPLYMFFEDPAHVYRGVLVLNAVLASAQVIPLYYLGRHLLGGAPAHAAAAALVTSMYPAFLLQSNFEWADNLFPLLLACGIVVVLRFFTAPSVPSALAFGLMTGALYFTHPRAVLVVPAAIAVLATLVMSRRLRGLPALVAAIVMIAGFVGTRLVNAYVISALYAPGSGAVNPGDSELAIVERILAPSTWGLFLVRLCSQLWYLTVGTLGLFPIGAVVLGLLALRAFRKLGDGASDPRAMTALLVLTIAGAILAVSAISVTVGDQTRVDHMVYGRYNEGWLNIVTLAGIVSLLNGGRRHLGRAALFAAGSVVVLGMVTRFGNDAEVFQGPLSPLNVMGLHIYIRQPGEIAVIATTLAALGAMGLIWGLLAWRQAAGVLAICVFFAVVAIDGETRILRPFAEPWMNMLSLQRGIEEIDERVEDIEHIAYDVHDSSIYELHGYEFWLDDIEFLRFDSSKEEPPAPLVVASKGWQAEGAELVLLEPRVDKGLWVRPGELQEDLEDRGFIIADPASPLPGSAVRSEIAPLSDSLAVPAGESVSLAVRVTHEGSGGPWVPLAALPPPHTGAVRLVARWYAGEGEEPAAMQLADFRETIVPGASAETTVQLSATDLAGVHLEPGRYRVRLELLQEGIQWFADHGDDVAEITVDVE